MREFDLIRTLLAPLATHTAARGLNDDAAVFTPPPGRALVVTKDMMAAGVHFLPDDPPGAIAARLLRVNLSDLAAMGAEPFGVLLGLGLTGREDDAWLRAFAAGLGDDLEHYETSLLGGDTIAGIAALTLSLTAIGHAPAGATLARGGAGAGDAVYVSGTVGDAGLGLDALRADPRMADPWLVQRYRRPEPRLKLGQALAGLATAAADVSDGLLADAGHIAEASGLGVRIMLASVPLSAPYQALRGADEAARLAAATAGDDYELVFTVPADREAAILALSERLALRLTRIGTMVAGAGVTVIGLSGATIAVPYLGYQHG